MRLMKQNHNIQTLSQMLDVYSSMVLKRKAIGLANDSWTKSTMLLTLLTTNIGLHTPSCGSLIRAVATKGLTNLQARSWSRTEDVDEFEILCGQGALKMVNEDRFAKGLRTILQE